jgi:tetratricopeptide (TPR) repeat protein
MSRAKTVGKTRIQSGKRPNPKAPPDTGSFLTGNSLNAVLCVLLAAVTIALYSPVLGHSFVIMDDQDYVTGNPHIQNGLAWTTIKWAFTSSETANWHPLTWLSHALDYQLFALNPAGHHFDSILIHALNAVLLFLLLVWGTKRVGSSWLVAALFAVHPLNVESVAWVAERKNVLSTLFFLLAIGAYAWYAQRPNWRRYLLEAALFAAGLMAKPMVITLPFVLLLLDYWPLERMALDGTEGGPAAPNAVRRVAFSKLVLEKIPLLFLSAASARITLITQHRVKLTLEQLSLGIRVENALVSYGLYLWRMIWPARLAAFYPHPANTLPMWQVMLSALLLAGGTALVVASRCKRYLPVGWFWFLGTLVPVLGLVQVGKQAMADRYAYIPLIGIFVMITWGLDDLAQARKVRTVWRVIPALCALLALGSVTFRQISYWESQYDLWSRALAVAENPFAHNAVGAALIDPPSAMTQHDLENFDTEQKRMDEARLHFERALELCRPRPDLRTCLPDMAQALTYLGFLDALQHRMDGGRQHFEEALKIYRQLAQQDPDKYLKDLAGVLNNLGNLDGAQNRMDDARQHFEEALKNYRQLAQQDPDKYLKDLAGTQKSLGFLDRLQDRMGESRIHYAEAMTIFQKLAQGDPARYAGDVANVEASLQELDRKGNSR